jgi:hypothetical protein
LLVLPDRPDIPPEVVARVEDLIAAGARVLVQNRAIAQSMSGTVFNDMSIDDALGKMSVVKDFAGDHEKLDFIHRKIGETELYFVRNKTGEAISEPCEFRATSGQPEFWDPVTARQYKFVDAQVASGRTALNLRLPPYGSCFIAIGAKSRNLPAYDQRHKVHTSVVKAPWTLSFPENRGAPSSVTLNALSSWSDHDREGIRHFSGTAAYQNSFTLSRDVA